MFTVVIDIGVPGKTLGWAATDVSGKMVDGDDIDVCIATVADALQRGPVALGFEAPMWIPTRLEPANLTKARKGEAGPGLAPRPFSAFAGPTALVTGMVVVIYVMRRLRESVPTGKAYFDWRVPRKSAGELLLWEAFVTNQKKSHDSRHVEDAKLAVVKFLAGIREPCTFSSDVNEADFMNLLGAALLKSGWTKDLDVLTTPCLVVRTN